MNAYEIQALKAVLDYLGDALDPEEDTDFLLEQCVHILTNMVEEVEEMHR